MTMCNSKFVMLLLILGLMAAGCGGSFGPPPECAEGLGGTADEALFGQYFNAMELISEASGQPGAPSDPGVQFAVSEPLLVRIDGKQEVTTRFCIQAMVGSGEIAFDQSAVIAVGETDFAIGAYEDAGTYVVRVIVDGVLVKNLPFVLE